MLDLAELIGNKSGDVTFSGVIKSYLPFLLAQIAKQDKEQRPIIFVASEQTNLEYLSDNLKFISPDIPQYVIPQWDCLPYDRVGPSQPVQASRLYSLVKMSLGQVKHSLRQSFVLTTVNAAMQKLLPREELLKRIVKVSTGNIFSMDKLIEKILLCGYERCSTVKDVGEFAVRGGILDIFPLGKNYPLRLDFFGEQIESIRSFDPITQKSLKLGKSLVVLPVWEVLLTSSTISAFRKKYTRLFGVADAEDSLYQSISSNRRFAGMEHWLSLFYDKLQTIFDYAPNAIIVYDHLLRETMNEYHQQIEDYYRARAKQKSQSDQDDGLIYNPLVPQELYLSPTDIKEISSNKNLNIYIDRFKAGFATQDNGVNFDILPVKNFIKERQSKESNLLEAVIEYITLHIKDKRNKVVLASWSEGSQSRIIKAFNDHKFTAIEIINNLDDFLQNSKAQVGSAVLSLEEGGIFDNLLILTEQDIFGEQLLHHSKKKRKTKKEISSLNMLKTNDLVVHINHGIGRFVGLKTIKTLGVTHDCLQINYASDDKLFLPVENIELLSRYGSDASTVMLDKLGSASWQARKAKLKKNLLEIAGKLIDVAAMRKLQKAPVMVAPSGLYDEFIARFPYQETEDQQLAINAVINDLASNKAMDRLICGDVGFGKTEVCLRAAFIAAMSGYQVALVVPTTLLARQHYNNFIKRFEGLPIEIAQLSRLLSPSKHSKIKEGIAKGTIEIVIGTHSLLTDSVKFKNLGLLIIDEEHHFGVKHKEKLKKIKNNIHILTLSATPIPRTLQNSLVGIKDLSLITTPPIDRLPIHSFVSPFDGLVVREMLLREYNRGGQSFFVCPRVSDLSFIEEFLHKKVPELKCAVAHGKMNSQELEDIITAFYEGHYDVLLSTTIIESGIDIPKANTIIIYRSDLFGLAALYQLRGRVGRAKQRAYALFTFSNKKILTKQAEARLKIMETINDLGGSFQLASHDMDIRGAGNLLGEEQSGHIKEVGYELYQQMLEEAVLHLKDSNYEVQEKWSPQINIGLSAVIPETYVSDVTTRVGLYTRLSQIENRDDLEMLSSEMIDRFGALPEQTENLLKIIYLKLLCKQVNVEKLEANESGVSVSFRNNEFANGEALFNYLSEVGNAAKLRPDKSILFSIDGSSDIKRMSSSANILRKLISFI